MTVTALRSSVITFHQDPFLVDPADSYRYLEDALVVMADGKIVSVDPYSDAAADAVVDAAGASVAITHYPDSLVCAGFIDCHVHYPQTQMIGAFGEQLLEWLNKYTFIAEQQFADKSHADTVSRVFLRELLRAGTTTAAVYCTVHPESVDALFEESERFNTRMIAGKVLMDRHAPDALLDTAERGYDESKALLEKWHGRGRQLYCITPRFAASSTDAQLAAAARLWKEHPGTYMQTHLAENTGEIEWVRDLFPQRSSYLDVYDHAGLTGPRAIFGHAVHMDEVDFACCHRTGSALAHCPTSNLFLGSGLFNMAEAKQTTRPVRVGIGSDIGAGTSFSTLHTLNEAYKVSQMAHGRLTAAHAFYLATRGGAEALYLQDSLGSLAPGYDADLVVLDLAPTPLIAFRMGFTQDILEKLFVLMTLGDDRAVRATYVAGVPVYDSARDEPFRYAAEPSGIAPSPQTERYPGIPG
jgi:guanine deaminase